MSDDYEYTWEKLYDTVLAMAASPASIQERVRDAFNDQLHVLRPEDFPEALREKFVELHRRMTATDPVGDEGRYTASANGLSDEEAVEIAQGITNLFDEISSSRSD